MSDDLIKKLAKLHDEHPDLPVVTMVQRKISATRRERY